MASTRLTSEKQGCTTKKESKTAKGSAEEQQADSSTRKEFDATKNQSSGQPSDSGDSSSRDKKDRKPRQDFSLDLHKRYLSLEVEHINLDFDTPPTCSCCQHEMSDSGLKETSQRLHKIPARYVIQKISRKKYTCSQCCGSICTAPQPERIAPGSLYSDELILDVVNKKYNYLMPIERITREYVTEGLDGVSHSSLIRLTYHAADFFLPIYRKIRQCILAAPLLYADETPHRMLERGDDKQHYLWGFSCPDAAYYEIHNTRSGSVSHDFLIHSQCLYLVSDKYSGYNSSVTAVNKERLKASKRKIKNIYCNAHARRKFVEAQSLGDSQADFFIDQYRHIYRLDQVARAATSLPEEGLELRKKMRQYFLAMKNRARQILPGYSKHNAMYKACGYFLKSYRAFTRFLLVPQAPIDNNAQERLLRSAVIGRKTWFGTHSPQGAKTAAILFTIIETCRLNQIPPPEYFKAVLEALRAGCPLPTPMQVARDRSDRSHPKDASADLNVA